MAHATTIKEAIKKFEEANQCVAADQQKVRFLQMLQLPHLLKERRPTTLSGITCLCIDPPLSQNISTDDRDMVQQEEIIAEYLVYLEGFFFQVELYGQCPPIEKMDATLSTLKGCT
jgi:hypothetical protein